MHLAVGSKVFALPANEEYLCAATVQEQVMGRYFVRFDDGREEWIDSDNVHTFQLTVRQMVEVRFRLGESYQRTHVVRSESGGVVVHNAKGYEQEIPFSQVRVPLHEGPDFLPGDRVWGRWTGDDYWYPGTVEAGMGDQFSVRFDDGDQEDLSAERVKPLELPVGLRVLAYPVEQGGWVPGEIVSVDGDEVRLRYDYGEVITTTIRDLRTDFGEPTWHAGNRVFAQWDPEPYCYVGTIRNVQDDKITVEFDDGDQSTVFGAQVFWLYFVQGQAIEASRRSDRHYEPARVVQLQDEELQVRFEDGTTAWVELKDVRVSPDKIAKSG